MIFRIEINNLSLTQKHISLAHASHPNVRLRNWLYRCTANLKNNFAHSSSGVRTWCILVFPSFSFIRRLSKIHRTARNTEHTPVASDSIVLFVQHCSAIFFKPLELPCIETLSVRFVASFSCAQHRRIPEALVVFCCHPICATTITDSNQLAQF